MRRQLGRAPPPRPLAATSGHCAACSLPNSVGLTARSPSFAMMRSSKPSTRPEQVSAAVERPRREGSVEATANRRKITGSTMVHRLTKPDPCSDSQDGGLGRLAVTCPPYVAPSAQFLRHTISVDWSAIAAFTAAGLSLVNVAGTARLTRHSHLEQWRRDEESGVAPAVVRVTCAYTAPGTSGLPGRFAVVAREPNHPGREQPGWPSDHLRTRIAVLVAGRWFCQAILQPLEGCVRAVLAVRRAGDWWMLIPWAGSVSIFLSVMRGETGRGRSGLRGIWLRPGTRSSWMCGIGPPGRTSSPR